MDTPTAPDAAEVIDPHGLLDADNRAMAERLTRDPFLDPAFTVPQMRAAFEAFYAAMYAGRIPTAAKEDVTIAGVHGPIPLRLYRPLVRGERPLPMLVFFHGGGSIMGSLESYDALCQDLCAGSGCLVVSVDYRLAPDHPYRNASQDCYDATAWAYEHAAGLGGDAGRLAVGGESGGGGLAASVAIMARENSGPPIRFQLLIYPFVGTRGDNPSMQTFAKGYVFDAEDLEMFFDLNFPDREELKDWRVAPIWADRLDRLPPAFILTAEADILRDDAEDYARRLNAAGTPAPVVRYDGTIHGFVAMAGGIESGRRAIRDCAARLADALR
jgi:acetyl esterase